MVAPLPPVVDGPIYAVPNAQVYIDNVLPHALVKVLQAGSEVGHATSSAPGGIWVPTTVALVAGKLITATQTYTGPIVSYIDATPGVSSAPSNVAVPVLAVPEKLPVPVFLSGVSQCSSSVWVGSLIQGCTLHISQGGISLASALVVRPNQWCTLSATALVPGVVLDAQQEYRKELSPVGKSLPVFAEPTSLPKPVIGVPVRDCQTTLDISNVTPGANIEITNAGRDWYATSPWASYTLIDLPPLEAGTVTAQQYFTRCQQIPKSAEAVEPVTKTPVPLPVVAYPLCESVNQFTVSDLIPGEILTLKRVVKTGPSTETVTDIGSQGINTTTATVNLPPGFSPTDPHGPVSIRLSVTLCGLETSAPPYVTIPFSTAPGPFPAPTLETPLYDCATSVTVRGAHPGSLIKLITPAGVLLSNPVVATTANFVMNFWSPLVTGEQVEVEQQGCHADGHSKPATIVAVPNPLPSPAIVTPVLAGVSAVDVTGVIPGARVYLYVDGIYRSQLTTFDKTAALSVGTPALTAQQYVQVTQAICTETSERVDRGPGYAPVLAPVPAPPEGLISNFNYFLDDGGTPLTGVILTINFTTDFVSTANGYSFQLNGYSTEGPTITTEWQQFVIYASPSSTQLVARIDTWAGTSLSQELNRIDVNLAVLPTPTITAGTSIKIVLTYDSSNGAGTVTGATYTVTDTNTGTVLGTQTITIVGQTLRTTGLPATALNQAPVAAFQFNIGGDYGSSIATLSSGAGTIVYASNVPLTVVTSEPGYTDFDDGTGESGNIVFGQLPASNSQVVTQTFQVVPPAAPAMAQRERGRPGGHALPPPDDRSFGRQA